MGHRPGARLTKGSQATAESLHTVGRDGMEKKGLSQPLLLVGGPRANLPERRFSPATDPGSAQVRPPSGRSGKVLTEYDSRGLAQSIDSERYQD